MGLDVHVIRCAGDPNIAPTNVGQHWINTSTKEMWLAVGTDGVGDWQKLENDTDIKVKVSSNDTTSAFLDTKISAGTGITLTEQNDGGNESLEIKADGTAVAENAFKTIDTPNGTNPVADAVDDTLNLTSADSSITITGNSSTDTVDFVVDDSQIDHTQIANIGTNSHAQIDTHIADTNNPHQTIYYKTINAPNGTDPSASTVDDTLNLTSGDSSVTITGTTGTDTVDFQVDESNVDHDALNNFVANEHIDWTQASAGTIDPSNYVDNNDKAKITSNDTTADYLLTKIQAGTNVIITENNDGGNETMTIAATGSLSGELPSVQLHRSTARDITSTNYEDITFDVKDEENDTNVLEYDTVNTDRIKIKEDGLYYVYFGGQGYTSTTRDIEGRIRLNDATVIPGSEFAHRDASGGANGYERTMSKAIIFEASENDFLSLQMKVTVAASAGQVQYRQGCISIFKLQGAKGADGEDGEDGATGPTGSGSNIIVKEGNVSVTNTPHSELDFDANNFNVSDQGSGRALIQLATGGDARRLFYADQFDNPINSNWAVNGLASAEADEDNEALVVRAFDDGAEEGIGFMLPIPVGVTQMKLSFKSRAKTAPTGSPDGVELNLYTREIPDNSAIGSWSSANNINGVISLPTNENYQYDSHTFTLSSMSSALTAGRLYQFELTRDYGAVGDTLTGDWYLLELIVEFIS